MGEVVRCGRLAGRGTCQAGAAGDAARLTSGRRLGGSTVDDVFEELMGFVEFVEKAANAAARTGTTER